MRIRADPSFDHKDPYEILGVEPDASTGAIRKAYLALARTNHPNLFATDPDRYRASNAMMQDINAAYELLSDPERREFWDRSHPRRAAPRTMAQPPPVTRRPTRREQYYDAEQVSRIIRQYNEFLGTLRTAAERDQALRRIHRFQQSRSGTAFIRELVSRHYWKVMALLKLDKRVSVYDDGLVEIMQIFEGALEIAPSQVFITYAWVTFREHHGKVPAWLARPKRRPRGRTRVRIQLPKQPEAETASRKRRDTSVGAKVWHWLWSKPGEG